MSHPALAALRAGTADVHELLESELPLVDAGLTQAEYHAVLARFWGLVAPLEARLDRCDVPLPDWEERRKAHLLELDLGGTAGIPTCDELPALGDPDRVLGCLYVVEGSTLGGRHVAAAVERNLGPDVGTRYFRSYGDEVGTRWRSFRVAVAAHADAGGRVDVMVESARDTFAAFRGWVVA